MRTRRETTPMVRIREMTFCRLVAVALLLAPGCGGQTSGHDHSTGGSLGAAGSQGAPAAGAGGVAPRDAGAPLDGEAPDAIIGGLAGAITSQGGQREPAAAGGGDGAPVDDCPTRTAFECTGDCVPIKGTRIGADTPQTYGCRSETAECAKGQVCALSDDGSTAAVAFPDSCMPSGWTRLDFDCLAPVDCIEFNEDECETRWHLCDASYGVVLTDPGQPARFFGCMKASMAGIDGGACSVHPTEPSPVYFRNFDLVPDDWTPVDLSICICPLTVAPFGLDACADDDGCTVVMGIPVGATEPEPFGCRGKKAACAKDPACAVSDTVATPVVFPDGCAPVDWTVVDFDTECGAAP